MAFWIAGIGLMFGLFIVFVMKMALIMMMTKLMMVYSACTCKLDTQMI